MAPHQPAGAAAVAGASTKSMLIDIGQLLRSKLSLHGVPYQSMSPQGLSNPSQEFSNPSQSFSNASIAIAASSANTASVGINTSVYGSDSLGNETANAVN